MSWKFPSIFPSFGGRTAQYHDNISMMHIAIPRDQTSGDHAFVYLGLKLIFMWRIFWKLTLKMKHLHAELRKGLIMIQDQYLSKTSGLICGEDNCNGSGFDSTDDCCVLPIDQGIYFWQYSKGFVRRCKQVTFSWKVEFYFMKMFQTGVKPTETAERIIFTLPGTFNYLTFVLPFQLS